MKSAYSRLRIEVDAKLDLLQAAASGQVEDLPCPQCQKARVSVWFTHPEPKEYRTWFTCEACGLEMRAQNTGKPAHYSKKRDRTAKVAVRK